MGCGASKEPLESRQVVEPAPLPAKSIEPVPTKSAESLPLKSVDPSASPKAAEPPKAAKPFKAVDPPKLAESTESVAPLKAVESSKAVEPAKVPAAESALPQSSEPQSPTVHCRIAVPDQGHISVSIEAPVAGPEDDEYAYVAPVYNEEQALLAKEYEADMAERKAQYGAAAKVQASIRGKQTRGGGTTQSTQQEEPTVEEPAVNNAVELPPATAPEDAIPAPADAAEIPPAAPSNDTEVPSHNDPVTMELGIDVSPRGTSSLRLSTSPMGNRSGSRSALEPDAPP